MYIRYLYNNCNKLPFEKNPFPIVISYSQESSKVTPNLDNTNKTNTYIFQIIQIFR